MVLGVLIATTRSVGPDQHVEYEVRIGGKTACWKRYREFDDLCKRLKKSGFDCGKPFPPKRLFGGNSSQVIGERLQGLGSWLSATISSLDKSTMSAVHLREFLLADPWADEISQSNSTNPTAGAPQVKQDNRLKDIVLRFATAASTPVQLSLPKISKAGAGSSDAIDTPIAQSGKFDKIDNLFTVLRASKN